MADTTELKKGICERWSDPDRVQGWVQSGLNAEFRDAACRRAWMAALRQAVGDARVQEALDIGTGPGTIAQLWAEIGYVSTGLDFSAPMLRAGRAAAAERGLAVTFVEGDAEAPPFPARRFDLVSSRFVLFTLPHPGYAVRRWMRLLQRGGVMVLIGHENPNDPKGQHHPRRSHSKRHPDKRHEEALRQLPFVHHTAGELTVVMEAAGLRDIRRIPMEQVIAARAARFRRKPATGAILNAPYILVGRK
ncbi:MAG: class I SAM-dependent methyltransferase [Phycisphaerae bacterium]|nr:class I SAM-dependent methyltransferase [Phycisphaerae bacterium]